MSAPLALVHTGAALVATFAKLAADLAPEVPVTHVVDESLLDEARAHGGITPHLNRRVATAILNAADSGARVILCTCSSIGPCVDVARPLVDRPVLRVDRPMAEAAVRKGGRIAVAATLSTTLLPTCDLIRQAARDAGRSVEIDEVLCEKAWAAYARGDRDGYTREIAADLRRAAGRAEVIVLAQASMAGAAELLSDLATPILTSRRSGFDAALHAYQEAS